MCVFLFVYFNFTCFVLYVLLLFILLLWNSVYCVCFFFLNVSLDILSYLLFLVV